MSMVKMFEEDGEIVGPESTLQVYCEKHSYDVYRVFIDEEITSPAKYRNVVNVLEGASEDDTVEFRLNTVGGSLSATLPMYNGILNTKAKTRAILDGPVISAGTFLALACDTVVVMKNATMMCHQASYGTSGDSKSVKDFTTFSFEHLTRVIKDVYRGFLTDAEIGEMVEHRREFWLYDDEIVQRLKNRQEYLEEEKEKDAFSETLEFSVTVAEDEDG